jgi:hypothetical protein
MTHLKLSLGKNKVKKVIFLTILTIIPFLTFFLYTFVYTKTPYYAFTTLFVNNPPEVKYSTFRVSFDENISLDVQEAIIATVDDIELNGIKRFEFVDEGEYTVSQVDECTDCLYSLEYVPVGHPYWVKSNTTLEEIKSLEKIYIPSDISDISKTLLTQISGKGIETFEEVDDMTNSLKGSENVLGLISVNDITKEVKVLSLENNYYLGNNQGSLFVGFDLSGSEKVDFVKGILQRNIEIKYGAKETYIDQEIAKINMSGVVAISRGLAKKIDTVGEYGYPASEIGDFLADADLTHISNEVSFVNGCDVYSGMRFCSKPEYIQALKDSGVDIVELTGNHNNDFGADKNRDSIQMYKDLGWDYFGGGLNSEDASKVLYKEVKGSTIAFVGYNYFDTMLGTGAIASSTRAGANSYSVSKLESDIKEARGNSDVVIVTFQFQECWSYPSSDVIYPPCYKPLTTPDQKGVFRRAIDLGADVVVGTQAHQPQTYEIYNGGLIFYGLGNLYFDQSRWIGTRQGTILTLYIQDGKLLQAKITPTLMGTDLITRLAGKEDGELLLNLLKSARTF